MSPKSITVTFRHSEALEIAHSVEGSLARFALDGFPHCLDLFRFRFRSRFRIRLLCFLLARCVFNLIDFLAVKFILFDFIVFMFILFDFIVAEFILFDFIVFMFAFFDIIDFIVFVVNYFVYFRVVIEFAPFLIASLLILIAPLLVTG